MKIFLHQTHHSVADFTAIEKEFTGEDYQAGLHLFPELFLTGYPLQDLCLIPNFIQRYQKLRQDLDQWSEKKWSGKNVACLVGGLEYVLNEHGLPDQIYNVMIAYMPGKKGEVLYRKRLLPNYDIFDEQKYFSAGKENKVWTFNDKNFVLTICEDMWSSNVHQLDPCHEAWRELSAKKQNVHAVINLSASPYNLGKQHNRHQRAKTLSKLFNAPFLYVNRVGGEDEILFDGSSFVADGDQIVAEGKFLAAEVIEFNLPENSRSLAADYNETQANTWEGLFTANLNLATTPPTPFSWNQQELEQMQLALQFGLQEYARKSGFSKFLVALSGGMDSALVLTLIKLSLKPGQQVEAIYMPSIHSSSESYDLSAELCKNLQIRLTTLPIKFLHSTAKNAFTQSFTEPFEGLTDENIQSRLRGLLLYTRSNQIGAMVVNTSNKSELAVGYSTQYGDSVGAISMLGDLYKTEVYQLAEMLNQKYNNIIPPRIITRPPTAELRPGQTDAQSLPEYPVLDAILEGLLSYRWSKKNLLSEGFDEDQVVKIIDLYQKTEYKRAQFCPIIKLKAKSFGFGHRVPISKNAQFYQFEP